MSIDLAAANAALEGKTPQEIIAWAIENSENPLVTTNFRPYESVILHMAVQAKPDIKVLWVDSGYNTSATYRFAEKVIQDLNLNVETYIPQQTSARRNVLMKGIPDVGDELHDEFTRQVKLEPFQRALAELKPDLWLNAIRKDQTEFRQSLEIVSASKDGIIKVAPLFNWTDADLEAYLEQHNLPNEHDYFDPTKAVENRECGLHTQL
ncbi:phosphoadenosine phosphosulfate reductase family protein [Neptunomonas phycophila]|jgi:phosphoadenosine phosphosulfate reductase|uniref:phosphoadenosine phosphosulfate reductase domain-containing protein n=1 Tax=Neptunomonas TaxID=75687 RepID=UPI0009489D15|nr:phosphoadenosine phosphosulfate reductase family protein [Neptunomonas phycophila]MBT3144010.1 phosphoadenosine phosphosulfate reductase family protein [Neptunomonas phycophila]MDO6467402.1 phosphoadenosine phosphosulfate reductase family protein [Neptunomonas phycophila]MDO6782814.1 phosphoadenosine phosphosulfate reductase family protein [Neptunomonas phycophila]QLE97077.1 phosphoadenylylsulfate reductase [Neptunomonas phycophila]